MEAILSGLGLLDRSERADHSWGTQWDLPVPEQADYRFWCLVYSGGEPQLGARRLGADPDEYFWLQLFEDPDFDSDEQRTARFTERLTEVVSFPSRIQQRRGLLSWVFHLEVEDSGSWRRLYSAGCLRTRGLQVPNPESAATTYRSSALLHFVR